MNTAPPHSSPWRETIAQDFKRPELSPSAPFVEVVNTATSALEQHLLTSLLVRNHLIAMAKGPGTNCPDSPIDEIVKYVAHQKGTVDKSDPALTLRFLTEVVGPVFDLERQIIIDLVHRKPNISQMEWQFFSRGPLLASAIDRLWARWFETIVIPYQALDAEKRQAYEEKVRDTLAHYDYTVFTYDPEKGCTHRRTWAQAFPEEVQNIVWYLNDFRAKAEGTPYEVYFEALSRAYGNIRIEDLEELWEKVDEAWIRIPRSEQLIPVHGMESGYEHPFGVSPEFRLEVRTAEGRSLIEEKRSATLDHAAAFGLSNELVAGAVHKLERIDISVFTSAIRAGTCMNFRYAGQAVPNREKVLTEGGRIFLDQSASLRAAKQYIDKIERHCSPHTAHLLVPLITGGAMLSHTATHEYAHPVGRTTESDRVLGSDGIKQCEEAKATLLGILADERRDPSPQHRTQIIACTLGRVLRFMDHAELSNTTLAPYVRENLAAATMLFESGVITLTSSGVKVHQSVAQGSAFFKALRIFNRRVLAAYQAKDRRELDRIVARYCNREHPEILKLIAWVNR